MAENVEITTNELQKKIRKLFDAAREQAGCNNVVEAAKKLYTKVDNNGQFSKEFIDALKCCLVYTDKSAVDKMLLFVSKFAASLYSYKALVQDSEDTDEDLEHPFINGLMTFIFQTHSAASADVRLRCTTLVNYILSAMPEESWLPVSIWNGLSEMTRSRLQDRKATVRVAAVLVAKKLQEPKNPQCEIVKSLLFHMVDPAPAVRRAVVSSIALSKATIGVVIERTLDINENVRRNAFAVLAKVRFQNLTIAQRITLLEHGLRDRVDRVRHCVESVMIAQWVDQVNKDILSLLEGLDVVNCSEIASLAVESIIKCVPIEELVDALKLHPDTHLIPIEHLSPEAALLWKILIKHASQEQLEDVLDLILPNITGFCDLLKDWYPLVRNEEELSTDPWLEVKQKHVTIHLLELAVHLDFIDDVGRNNLRKHIISMLISPMINNTQLVDKLIELLYVVIPDVPNFLTALTEVISEIREPETVVFAEQSEEQLMKKELEIAGYKLALSDLREKEYEAASLKDYIRAAQLSSEIQEITGKIENLLAPTVLVEAREEKTDPETICKCLRILVKMVPCSRIRTLTHDLKCLHENLLSFCLTSEDLMTQSLAITALAQFCILDKTLAQKHLLGFLLMLSENGDDEINIPALKAVFDILQINGTQCLNTLGDLIPTKHAKVNDITSSQTWGNELSVSAEKCIAALKQLMNSTENGQMKLIAFQGFCKLLHCGVIYSPSLLKDIIIKGFTPTKGIEVENRIRQLFMVFFPLFARKNPRSQEMIEAAFMPVTRALSDARLDMPGGNVDPLKVMEFLIDSTRPGINPYTDPKHHVHDHLALAICQEILNDAADFENLGLDKNYLKGFTLLQLSHGNESHTQQLRVLFEKMRTKTNDSSTREMLKKIQNQLKTLGESVASIQNTLENTSIADKTAQNGGNNTRFAFPASRKATLDAVSESAEDVVIEEEADDETAAVISKVFIAESPDISEEST